MKKLPARYNATILPAILSGLMTLIISFITTFANLGLGDLFLQKWLSAWIFSWLIAFPTLVVLLPIVRKLVANFVEPPK